MLKTVEEARRFVSEKLTDLQRSVFNQPPGDWAAFQRLQGEYSAYQTMQDALTPPRSADE